MGRVSDEELTNEAAPEVVPGLAVEVLSPGNTPNEMSRKLREYFSAGVPLVWFVDPPTQSVTVYSSPTRSKVVPLDGTLDGGKVLPGFHLPVAKNLRQAQADSQAQAQRPLAIKQNS